MITNEVLNAIRGRRSILRFEPTPVKDEELEAILEAGRWAPSFANSQPWTFVVVRDEKVRQELGALVERIAFAHRGQFAMTGKGIGDAPVVIAVVVDPVKDPQHWVEAGAVATQNMALMAHSLGLASYWAGLGGSPRPRRGGSSGSRKGCGSPPFSPSAGRRTPPARGAGAPHPARPLRPVREVAVRRFRQGALGAPGR